MITANELIQVFSRNARLLCKRKGIKIGELEKSIGASQGYLARMELNGGSPNLYKMYMTSKALGVSIDDLLDWDLPAKLKVSELREELKSLVMTMKGENYGNDD